MQVQRLKCACLLHDGKNHQELKDLLREMPRVLSTVYQARENMHRQIYSNTLQVFMPVFRYHLFWCVFLSTGLFPQISTKQTIK